MNRIDTEQDLREALKQDRCCVIFGKDNCLHCSIAKNVAESMEKAFSEVCFHCTDNTELAKANHVEAYPTVCFYENGLKFATVIGSDHLSFLKYILAMWLGR